MENSVANVEQFDNFFKASEISDVGLGSFWIIVDGGTFKHSGETT